MFQKFVHIRGFELPPKRPIKNPNDIVLTVLLKMGHNNCVESLNRGDRRRKLAILQGFF